MGRWPRRAVRGAALLSVGALLAPVLVVAGVAPPAAAADPIIQLAKQGPSQILVGDTATYTLTASNPSGADQVPQYNLSFRDVLPPGVVYVGPTTPSGAGTPQIVTNRLVASDPASEYQTLVWSNVADLQVNSTSAISFTVRAARDPWPVSSSFPNVANAYTNADPRFVPKFDATGTVVPGPTSFTASATASTVNTGVTAFRITKSSSPTPEGELLRGIHDHVATYTLQVTNNPSFATNAVEIRDYLPAGLEFLGCGGVDNTPPSILYQAGPADPTVGLEYPGAPPLSATAAVPGCEVPVSVETVLNPLPDAGRSFPPGVYTKVTWRIGDFTAGQAKEIVYRAGIPQRANKAEWISGSAPPPTAQGTDPQPPQTANLDNNTGPSTREAGTEQALTNIAVGNGLYTGPVQGQPGSGPFPVASSTDHTVTAEDVAMQKRVSPGTFDSSGSALATYTLELQVSEYVTAAGITITDVLPDGVCPVWRSQTPTVTGALPAECGTGGATQGADPTNATLTSVTREDNGTFTLILTTTALPANGTVSITYQGRMRAEYTSNGQPTSAGDTYTNTASLAATTSIRTDINVNAPQPDGSLAVSDASSATQSSTQPVIDKRIKPNVPGAAGYRCEAGTGTFTPGSAITPAGAAEYVDPATASPALTPQQITFRNGSVVCFLLRVEFPGQSRTKNPVITDFLPAGTTYVPNSAVVTERSTLQGADVAFDVASGVPTWRVGAESGGNRFAPAGAVFEVVLAARIDAAASGTTPDLVGNLMKFRSENTAGQAISLRDQLDLQIAPLPPVSLVKGIARITPPGGPTTDVNVPPAAPSNQDGRTVRQGDVVQFRIDVTNTSTTLGEFASSVRTVDVWDLLPVGSGCATISNPSAAAFFTCTDPGAPGYPTSLAGTNRSLVRWQFDASDANAIEPGARTTLTYDFTVPPGTSVSARLTDDAGVRSYQAFTNLPGQAATYFPLNNVDPSVPVADRDAPRADDPSNVVLPDAAVAKTSVTSVTATNNNLATQATVGESVTYTYSVTIPARTTVFAGSLTDVLPAGFVVTGPATAEFCPAVPPSGQPCASPTAIAGAPGTVLPGGTVVLDPAVGSVSFGVRYDNATTTDQRVSVTIPVQVTQAALAASANAQSRTNRADFRSTVTQGGSVLPTRSASRTINVRQPAPVVTKTNSTTGPVAGGTPVTFTVTARNQSIDGTSTNRPPLYDAVLVDCVPAQLQVVAGSVSDAGSTTPGTGANGCAAGATRIEWQVGTIEPGAAIPRTYQAVVTPVAVGGDIYTNTVQLTGTSMPGAVAGERAYSASAISEVEVLGAALAKSVDKDEVTIGERATWTLRATVPADVVFYGAALLDSVPAGITGVQLLDVACSTPAGVDCAAQFPSLGTALQPSPTTIDGSAPVTYGWLIGDGLAADSPRTITVRYTAQVVDLPLNAAGRDLVNSVRAGWFERPVDPPTDAGQTFARTSAPATATTNVVEPRVTVVKAVSTTAPRPGDVFQYTLRVTNGPGNDLSPAFNIVVRDVVPTGVVVSPASISAGGTIAPLPVPTTGGGTITWDAADLPGPLAPNSSIELTYTARLAPSSGLTGTAPASVLRNTATVDSFQSLPSEGRTYTGPSATADLTPAFPRLASAKQATGGPVAYLGEAYTWTVSTTNTGTATAFAVDIVDLLPPNWSYVPDSAQASVAGGPAVLRDPGITVVGDRQQLTWSDLGQLSPGAVAQVVFQAVPGQLAAQRPGTGAGVPHVNEVNAFGEDATGATGNRDGSYGDRPAQAQTAIHQADLALVKGHIGTPVAGGAFDWTIDVRNNGPDTAVGPFTVTDAVQAPMTLVSATGAGWTCTTSGADVSCTRTDPAATLAPGGSFGRIVVRVAIPSDTALPATLENTASVTGRTLDPNPGNNTGTDQVLLTALADLVITKGRSGPLEAGREVAYTLDVANLGPSTSRADLVVADVLPAGTTFVSAVGSGWACPTDNDPPITTVTCTRGADLLAGGAAPQLVVTLLVDAGFTGTLANTATVTGPTPDPRPANNTSTVSGEVARNADVVIEKTHSGPFTVGTSTGNTYTFTVGNLGPATAEAPVRFTDVLPEHLSWTGEQVDGIGTWACTADPASPPTAPVRQTVTCTLSGGLAVGQTARVDLGMAVAASAPAAGEFVNTATVTSGTNDPNPSNNTSTDRTAFDSEADLRMTKTPKGQTVVAGQNATWQLTVANAGPSPSEGPTTVTDVLPDGMTVVSAGGSGWQECTVLGATRTITCVHPDGLAAAGSLPAITVVASVAPSAGPASLVNTASVDGPTNDPDPTNNTDTARATVIDEVDLAITKAFTGDNPVAAGATTTFELSVRNNGPSDADGVLVADELPPGLALVPDGASGEGWSCGVLGRVVTCARPSLAALATAPVIRLEVQVDPGFQQRRIDNEAVVSSATTDVDLSNNRSTAGFDVTFSADLVLTKTHDPDVPVVAGQPVTFDLIARNDGPSDAQAPIVVRDTLPPGLSYLADGPLWSCTTSGTPAVDQQVECILDGDEPLLAGTAAPVLTLTAQVGADVPAGELVNRAAVSSSTPDPKPGNNTAADPIVVTTVADLVVAKSHEGPVRVGEALAFVVVVTNAGPSQARDVTVTDALPDGLTFVAAAGTDWTCTSPAGQVRCELAGPLAPGASAPPVTVTTTVEPTAFPGVENVVDVTTSTPETTTDNNRATDTVIVPPLVDLTIDKSHAGSFTVGQQGTYTLAVTNAGPTPDPGPQTITDTLPIGLSFVSAAGPGWACSAAGATVTCVREAVLQVGASAAVSLVVAVAPEAAPSVVNTASVSTPSNETTTANNTDADPTVVIPVSVLTIDKSVADLDGDLVTYLVVVANSGPNATSAPIVVVDPLPEGLTFVSVSGSGWACSEGRTVTCTFAAPLPVGGEAAFELVARLVADPGVTVRNVASIIDGESAVVTDDAAVTSPAEGGGSGGGAGSGGLADSGADVARQLALALLLLVLGAAAVQRAHRLR